MNDKKHSSKAVEMLKRRYILALSIIACLVIISQVIIQVAIISEQDDSRVVNLAGRQRMLCQRINKAAFGLYIGEDGIEQKKYSEELFFSLNLWMKSHNNLQYGDQEIGLPGKNSQVVKGMFTSIEPQYNAIAAAATEIINISKEPGYNKEALKGQIRIIQDNETEFLKGMDAIVFQYDSESKDKIKTIKAIEIALLLVTFFTLSMEALYIFRPAQKQIETSMKELEASKDSMDKIFETAPNAMLLIDEDSFKIKKLNHSAKKILKISDRMMNDVDFNNILAVGKGLNKEIAKQIFSGEPVQNMEVIFDTAEHESLVMLLSSNIIKYEEQNTVIVGLSDITKLKEAEEVLKRYATIDEMTGLLNKRTGMIALENMFNHAKIDKKELTVCFMDIDGLKFVNDNYGHEEGDFYIKTVARVINSNVNYQDIAFRYGGDEMVLVLNNSDRKLGEQVAIRIEKNMRQVTADSAKPYEMHVSSGLAVLGEQETEVLDALLSIADNAMYENKRIYKQSQ